MFRHIVLAAGLALCAINPTLAAAVLTLDEAVNAARNDNPGLEEMAARAEAAAAVPSQAGALPDPMASFMAMNLPADSLAIDQEEMTQLQFGLAQSIPFPGKRRLRREAAEHAAAAAEVDVDEARASLSAKVKGTWWDIFYLDHALESLARNRDLLRGSIRVARAKYKVGQGLQQDVLLAEVELTRLLEEEIGLNGRRRAAEARLNALMDRPVGRAIALPNHTGRVFPLLPGEETLLMTAETARPLLLAGRRRIDAAQARLKLAKTDHLPDFRFNAGWGVRSGSNPINGRHRPDFLTAGVALTIPLYKSAKQDQAVLQRSSDLAAAWAALDHARGKVQTAVAQAVAAYSRHSERAKLLEDGLLPQVRQTAEAMSAAYQTSQVDFLNLVTAQRAIFNTETQYWQALSAANKALAALAAAVGSEQFGEEQFDE